MHNLLLTENAAWLWAILSMLVLALGVFLIVCGTDTWFIPKAYFSISPDVICFKPNFYSSECQIAWHSVTALHLSDNIVLFDMVGGVRKKLRLSAIHSHNMASRVVVGLRLAALERNVTVNGVRFNVPISKREL